MYSQFMMHGQKNIKLRGTRFPAFYQLMCSSPELSGL